MDGPGSIEQVQSNGTETCKLAVPRGTLCHRCLSSDGLKCRYVDTWNFQRSTNPFLRACYQTPLREISGTLGKSLVTFLGVTWTQTWHLSDASDLDCPFIDGARNAPLLCFAGSSFGTLWQGHRTWFKTSVYFIGEMWTAPSER
jgi:hypothetical protein